MDDVRYTPTEQRMLEMLSDGMRHLREELHTCLWDEQSSLKAIRVHICRLRVKLRRFGEDLICETDGRRLYYRHVRLLVPAGDGKR